MASSTFTVAFSHTSNRIFIDGVPRTQIKSIKYGHGIEDREGVQGTGRQVEEFTEGNYKSDDASITMSRKEWDRVRTAMGKNFFDKTFPIVVYKKAGNEIQTDIIGGCLWIKPDHASDQGGAANEITVTVKTKWVLENGQIPFEGFKFT